MSKELDTAIELALEDYATDIGAINSHELGMNETITELKQAFTDAGYVQVPQVELTNYSAGSQSPHVFTVMGKEVMTGQEWYDRLMKELNTPMSIEYKYSSQVNTVIESWITDCARRASGLPIEETK